MGKLSQVAYLLFSQTAKDTYWIFASNLFTTFLAFLYTIFLARVFSPEVLGVFSAVVAFMLLVSDIADFGIGSSLSRFLPPLLIRKEKAAFPFIKTAFLFQIKLGLIFSLGVLIFSPILAEVLLKSKIYHNLFIVSAVGIFGSIILAFSTYVLSAQKKFQDVAMLNVVSTLTKVILVITFFLINRLTIFTAIFIFAASSFFAYFFSFKFLSFAFLREKEKKGELKRLLSFSLFLGISRIFAATASRLDALMLVPLASQYEAGIYAGAFKIVSLYILLAGSFSLVIAPRLSGFPNLRDACLYLQKVIFAVFLILASMILLYFSAPWFVVFILGKSYMESVSVFQALLLPIAFFVATIPGVNFLLYTLKKPQVSTFNTFIQLLVIFFGNLFFIPRLGRYGPVVVLTLAYGFTFLSSSIFAWYFYKKAQR